MEIRAGPMVAGSQGKQMLHSYKDFHKEISLMAPQSTWRSPANCTSCSYLKLGLTVMNI